jgi:hypothetical protein
MIITKKALSRRTVLRGMGVTLAFPYLDAMIPALSAAPKPPKRLAFFYTGNGQNMQQWLPRGDGPTFELGPIMNETLQPYRNKTVIVTGLYSRPGSSSGDGGGTHTRAMAGWLSGVRAVQTEVNPVLGKTADQYAADVWGQQTTLPSLELATSVLKAGQCDHGYTCAYMNVSWRTPTAPNPVETSPRQLFERLFGDGGTPEQRVTQLKARASILDRLVDDTKRFRQRLSPEDSAKVERHLEDIRSIERRIQRAEAQAVEIPMPFDRPVGVPESFSEYCHLMYDLLAAAFQADITRVATFVLNHEQGGGNGLFPETGVPDVLHVVSHHQRDADKLMKYAKINTYLFSMWKRLLGNLQSMSEGDSTVLDQSILMYGSGMSDGDAHDPSDVPVVLVGGGAGALKGGRVIRHDVKQQVPASNLLVSLLSLSGVPIDKIGDSTGLVEPLSL